MRKKNYQVITKEIASKLTSNNKNRDAYIFAYMKLCSDFNTGISHIKEDTLSEILNIPQARVSEAISRISESGLFEINNISKGGEEHPVQYNNYHFNLNPENFFFIWNEFFYTDLDLGSQFKGFLLRLKAVCINDTNYTLYNKTKLANVLNMDIKTLNKYLDIGIENNKIIKLNNGFGINDDNIPPRTSRNQMYDNLYSTISSYLICHGTIPPLFDKDLISRLSVRFPRTEEQINKDCEFEEDKKSYRQKHSLIYNLNHKCQNLPKQIKSLAYFTEIFNLDSKSEKPFMLPLIM